MNIRDMVIAIVVLLAMTLVSTTFAADNTNELSNKQKVVRLLEGFATKDKSALDAVNPNKYIQHNLAAPDGVDFLKSVYDMPSSADVSVNVVRVFEDGDYVFAHTEYNFFSTNIGFDVFRFEDGLIVEHWDNVQAKVEHTVSGRSQIDGATTVTDLDKTEQNKALVKGLIDDVFTGKAPEKIADYISAETYHEHSPYIGDGLDALKEAFAAMANGPEPFEFIANHLILGEGNFVLAISEGKYMGDIVGIYELFRIENGKIVEHWDTVEAIPPRSEWKNDNGKFGFQ